MANPHCECPAAGFCPRHQLQKNQREFELCKGVAHTTDCGRKYWLAWETGALGATPPANPITDPEPFCERRGLGDTVAHAIQRVTLGAVAPCGGCKGRQATLNHWFPAAVPPIETVSLAEATRHLLFHVWPVHGPGAWQWNCDQLLARQSLFNGRRIVAIATDNSSDSSDAVRAYLKDFTDEFVIVPNDPNLREVATWLPMLERLETAQSPHDVTLSCHAKGVRHHLTPDAQGTTIFRWTSACYETVMDWEAVRPLLETHGTVGSFRRLNAHGSGWGPFHFSGSFFWVRNHDVFRRNWRYVPKRFYGTEAWPGLHFKLDESACVFGDNVQDLYLMDYWANEIEPRLAQWRAERNHHEPSRA